MEFYTSILFFWLLSPIPLSTMLLSQVGLRFNIVQGVEGGTSEMIPKNSGIPLLLAGIVG